MPSENFEEAKAYLQNSKGLGGASLYDHLATVLEKIVKEKPDNALGKFEELSTDLKAKAAKESGLSASAKEKLLAANAAVTKLCRPFKEKASPDDSDEERPEHVEIPDILGETQLLKWGGVDLGDETMYQLVLSIQNLATQNDLTNVRLFGKILGTQADYYVVEAQMNDYPEEEDDVDEDGNVVNPQKEVFGEGLNLYVYYACNSPTGAWTRLPAVTPDMLILSRSMRRFFTGDLTKPVFGFPRFPYGEAAYLRTTIARICATTVVCPTGFYIYDEDDESVSLNEEAVPQPSKALQQASGWVHQRNFILMEGRQTRWEDPDEEELSDEEESARREDLKEKIPVPLRSVDQDQSYETSWGFRLHPCMSMHPDKTCIASAHSLLWPGAVAVCDGLKVSNIYVGFGLKYSADSYAPPIPPSFQAEYSLELTEIVDPVPPQGWTMDAPEPVEQEEEESDTEE